MKTAVCKLLLIVNLFPFATLAQTDTDARIKRVEQGLLPTVLIKGDPSWSIEERMKQWKVPGLSVAVIKDFKIKWARTATKKVTLANLLSHSGGLTVNGFPGYAVGDKLPTLPQVLDGVAPANTAAVRVDMDPGNTNATEMLKKLSGGGNR